MGRNGYGSEPAGSGCTVRRRRNERRHDLDQLAFCVVELELIFFHKPDRVAAAANELAATIVAALDENALGEIRRLGHSRAGEGLGDELPDVLS